MLLSSKKKYDKYEACKNSTDTWDSNDKLT